MPEKVPIREVSKKEVQACLDGWDAYSDKDGCTFRGLINGIRCFLDIEPWAGLVSFICLTNPPKKIKITGIKWSEVDPSTKSMTFITPKGGRYEISQGGLVHRVQYNPKKEVREISLGNPTWEVD